MEVLVISLIISFIWGIEPVIHKHLLESVNKKVMFVVGGFAFTACLVIFYIFNMNEVNTDFKKMTFNEIFWTSITMIFVAFVANLLYFYILKKNDSHIVSALIYSSPFFTLVFAYFFLHERITLLGLMGVVFIILGVVCIAFNEKQTHIYNFFSIE